MCGSVQSRGSRWAIRWPRTRYRLISVVDLDLLLGVDGGAVGDVVDVAVGADRLVGDAHGLEHPLVERVLADQQLVDALEEQP